MTAAAPSPAEEISSFQAPRYFAGRLFIPLVMAALLLGVARRALVGWDAPLWLDEAFTGAIAIQPTFSGLVQDCLHELSGPVYYTLIWGWEKLAGASNVSLRLPSFIFSVAAPLLILWKGDREREVRFLWAALAALWLPSFSYANEARPYALLFFLATAQCILFYRLLEEASRRRAVLWASVSSLLILTHYHALVVTGLQGLAFLVARRKTALATWPAALVFVPVLVWMSVHLPVHFRFAQPDVAWQRVLAPSALKAFPDVLLGAGRAGAVLLMLLAGSVSIDLARAARGKASFPYSLNQIITVGVSAAAIAIVYGLGFFRPSFVPRYLIPFIPGVLLGLAIWLRVWGRRVPVMPWIVILPLMWWAGAALFDRLRDPKIDPRWDFTWQQASEDVRASGAKRLIFFWDNPTTALGYQELLQRTGGFFFDRANVPIRTQALVLAGKGDTDPNLAIMNAARGDAALIWAYDSKVPNSLATRHPPRLWEIDLNWRCRNYGRETVTILACTRG